MSTKRRKTKHSRTQPAAPFRGRAVEATYHEQVNPLYQGNPLTEALEDMPENLTALRKALRFDLPFNEEHRSGSMLQRCSLVHNVRRSFVPLTGHFDVCHKIHHAIRQAYVDQNPLLPRYWYDADARVSAMGTSEVSPYGFEHDPKGFYIFGLSGSGKTTTVRRILYATVPQVIRHTEYAGQKFPFTQIPWVIVKAPQSGSLLGFGDAFLQAMDALTGAQYRREYIGPDYVPARGVDHMVTTIGRVARLHALGVLVIDDIQHLVGVGGRKDADFINFVENLVDTIGIPVIQIGTYKSLKLVHNSLRLARRGSGQGDVHWQRLNRHTDFELFLETIWHRQYVKHPGELTSDIVDTFYELTQGIIDFTMKLFVFAQERAIKDGDEKITPAVLERTAEKSFKSARSILMAIRDEDFETLADLDEGIPEEWFDLLDSGVTDPSDDWHDDASEASEPSESSDPSTAEEDAEGDTQGSVETPAEESTSSSTGKRSKNRQPRAADTSKASRPAPKTYEQMVADGQVVQDEENELLAADKSGDRDQD